MDNEVLYRTLAQVESAAARLMERARQHAAGTQDGVDSRIIPEFRACYELLCKLFNKIHMTRGLHRSKIRAAYECIAEAGAAGWLRDRALWESMIADYGTISGEHDPSETVPVVGRICEQYAPEMLRVVSFLKTNYVLASPLDRWKEPEH